MDEFEIEKRLQQEADEMEMRPFSEVWECVKDRVKYKPELDWKLFWKKTLVAVAVAAILVCPYVAIPFLTPTETLYSDELLSREDVEKVDFDTAMEEVEFQVVDFSLYIGDGYILYKTETGVVKGGSLNLMDRNYAWFMTLKFYEENVQLQEADEIEYDQTCTVGAATVEYRLKDYVAEYGMYVYDMKANYRSVNYLMEYTCMTDDLTPFLQSFFS